jgi:hypothetical protein
MRARKSSPVIAFANEIHFPSGETAGSTSAKPGLKVSRLSVEADHPEMSADPPAFRHEDPRPVREFDRERQHRFGQDSGLVRESRDGRGDERKGNREHKD